jgi:tRNA(fMet)-specific endonuclease VapC
LIPDREAVVVDTNVFGAALTRRQAPLVGLYARHLSDRLLVLAAQTVGELRYGALLARWGAARQAEWSVASAGPGSRPLTTTWCGKWRDFASRVAGLVTRWPMIITPATCGIAASAIRYQLPLVAHDGVFRRTPGLDLRTELA